MPGYESRAPVDSSSMHRKSMLLVEHSSSTPVNRWSKLPDERSSSTPGSETESTVEHSRSTPTKFAELNLEVLATVLMEHLSNTKTADKATQIPEKQPYVCFVCGHEAMEFASHRQHMLSLHRMDVVGIAVVYNDNIERTSEPNYIPTNN